MDSFNKFDLIHILQTQKNIQDILDLGISVNEFEAFKEEIKTSRNYNLICIGDTYRVLTKTAWEKESLTSKVMDMYNEGISVKDIAKEIGKNPDTIHQLLSRKRRMSAVPIGAEQVGKAIKEGKLNIAELSEYVGLTPRSVVMSITLLKKAGILPMSTCVIKGNIQFDKVRHEKLAGGESAVKAVQRLRSEGFSNAEIAKKINRSHAYVTAAFAHIKKMEAKRAKS
jgi:DNA-binding CsgD family transcriptional regulator